MVGRESRIGGLGANLLNSYSCPEAPHAEFEGREYRIEELRAGAGEMDSRNGAPAAEVVGQDDEGRGTPFGARKQDYSWEQQDSKPGLRDSPRVPPPTGPV